MPKITPHKGGRTAQLHCRITPDAKALLKRMASEHGVTEADIIAAAVKSFDDEFHLIERHYLVHGVKHSEYRYIDEENSFTRIEFNDGAFIEDTRTDEWNHAYVNNCGWTDEDCYNFFGGMIFELFLDEAFED